jgi:hypothetical protein
LPAALELQSGSIEPDPIHEDVEGALQAGLDYQRRRRKGLLPPGSVDALLRHAYYCALHADAEFAADLRALHVRLFPALAGPLDPNERAAAIAEADRKEATLEDDAAVREFCERHLPRLPRGAAHEELWAALHLANDGRPLRLRARWDGRLRLPALLDVDPLFESRAEARARQEARQHRAIEARWEELPSVYRDWATVRRLAGYLYMAVKGGTWSEIKQSEEAQGRPVISVEAIRSGVVGWAKRLGITLPKLKRGRPPRK